MEKKMAEITRTHGSAFGVANQDRGAATSGAISADEVHTANGPKLDFFQIIIKDVSSNVEDLRNELDPREGVERILQEIQTKANVELYQVEGDTSGKISVAVYPTGAWTNSTLQTAIQALTAAGANSLDCTNSTVADNGFEL